MINDASGEREARVAELLEHNVSSELQAMSALLQLGLSDVVVEQLAASVTSGVLYTFTVDWSPDWVKSGQVHAWEDGGAFYARCSQCLHDSPPAHHPAAATAWVRKHETQH